MSSRANFFYCGWGQSPNLTIYRFNESRPLRHLLGEGALRAIGIILQTEVFVNLQKSLLMRDRFQKLRRSRVGAEETRGGGFERPIGQVRRQFCVFRPNIGVIQEPEREDDVGQDFRDARFADECHFFWRGIRSERVMKFPKRMVKAVKEIVYGRNIFFA